MIKKTIHLIGRLQNSRSDAFSSDLGSEHDKKSESSAISYCKNSLYFLALIFLSSLCSLKAAIFDVNNAGDGAGSATVRTLRYCITQANASAGPHTITFAGLGAGTHTITLTSALPVITRQVSIQGYTATSALQGPLGPSSTRSIRIQINGNDLVSQHMFEFGTGSGGSSISGLAMYNTQSRCIFVSQNISGLHIWGNYFGLMADGTGSTLSTVRLEDTAIFVGNESAARTISNLIIGTNGDGGSIGGLNDANEGNVIVNTYRVGSQTVNGVFFYGLGTSLTLSDSKIAGNYFGLLPDGTTISAIGQNVPAAEGHAISFTNTIGSNVIVGTDANGTSDILERNVISGGTNYGIQIQSASGINIAGNYIGTDYTGTIAKPNGSRDGFYPAINIQQETGAGSFPPNNIVIGFDDRIHTAVDAPLVRNIISGNGGRAVTIATIAGATLATRTNNVVVAGNYIGVDVTGNVALPNGTFSTALTFSTGAGVSLNSVTNCRVGTNSDGVEDAFERNIISGNINGAGVYLASNNFAVTNNIVAGNYIGVGANGTTALGNGNAGVYINSNGNGVNNNRIGSNDDGTRDDIEANIIANNGYKSGVNIRGGIMITNSSTVAANASNNNRISRNVFYNNTGLPIDLASWNGTANNFGVSLNDGATTANQPNLLLDYPVITGYNITSATTLDVSGYVSICNGNEFTPGATIAGNKTIQFYKVMDDSDQNGAVTGGVCTRVTSHGEGIQYLGSITGVANAFTNQTLTLVSGATFSSGDKLVAIAIDANGNTSEFGATVIVADLAVGKTVNNPTAGVGSDVIFTITASNVGPDPASGVLVSDVLPSGYTLVSATPSLGTWTAPNWTIGNLAVGGTATLTVVATVNAGGNYTNTATISGAATQVDPVSSNNSATAAVNPDSDGDGIPDATDWDDDNDGILDAIESPNCFYTQTEAQAIIKVTSPYNASSGDLFTTLHNLNTADGTLAFNFAASQTITSGTAVFNFEFPTCVLMSQLAVSQTANGMLSAASRYGVLYASNDGINYTAISAATGVQLHTATVTFPITSTTPYRYYQIRYIGTASGGNATSGTLGTADIQEIVPTYSNTAYYTPSANPKPEVCISDVDSDGIPNHLDNDSDGDGCADVIEGGASFAIGASYIASDRLTTTVNANGVPGVPASTSGYDQTNGQTIAQSQNNLINDCQDFDGDSIPDWQDLDDDNDGILDTAEGYCESQTVYTLNMASTLASASTTFNANGASFNLVYNLTSGPAITGLGTTFNVPFTYSDLNNSATSQNHTWEGVALPFTTVLGIRPVVSSLFTNLPSNNTQLEDRTGAPFPSAPDSYFRMFLNQGVIDKLGTYTIKLGNLPTPTGQLSSFQNHTGLLNYAAYQVVLGTNVVNNGFYAKNQLQTTVNTTATANSAPSNMMYGQTIIYDYTAIYNIGTPANNVANQGYIMLLQNTITYCNHRDTDSDGIPDYLDLDSDGDGCSDAREGAANLTTFSDSTMPGGNSGINYNGLSTTPVIQNLGNVVDLNPASPSYGVPTIAGAGQAVGNSQNGFRNDCLDSDADGIPDWEDVDDDNDGILDTEECKTNTLANMAAAFGAGSLLTIAPSDFGLALNVRNQNVSRDLSAKFGYPANSGAVIISISNASVHPTVDTWWTKNGEPQSIWRVTGKMSAYVLMAQDNANFYANDNKTIHIYDSAPVVPVNIGPFSNQTAVAGQWSITETSREKILNNLNTNPATPESATGWRYANLNFGPKVFGFSTTVAIADPTYEVRMVLECDTDGDGVPDRLDLDSDADGCADAVEGGATISTTQLVTAAGSVSGGSTTVNQNLCASNACVSISGTNIGLPQFSTLPTGYSNTTGQSVGDSQNALVNGCVCYESPTDVSTIIPVKHGITLLGRAGSNNGNWPMIRNSAYTALESKSKGFVITRNSSPETTITVPVVGMMVFDMDENSGKGCLKIYTGSGAGEGWKCFTTQGCP